MPYAFTATVHQQTDLFLIQSRASVVQQIAGRPSMTIAVIQDSADPCDHRNTTITWAEGSLSFSAAYDGALKPHTVLKFHGAELSLHTLASGGQVYLCFQEQYYRIQTEDKYSFFRITVSGPLPEPKWDGASLPVLASVGKTEHLEAGFAYEIQTREVLPPPLLMAIFSLPFTLNLPIGTT